MTATTDLLQVLCDDSFSRLALTLPVRVNPSSVGLQSLLKGDSQAQRPTLPANASAENTALVALAMALGEAPHTVFQLLADNVLALLKAGSAGVSVLTVQSDGGELVSWPAIAGRWQAHSGCSRMLLAPAATLEPAAERCLVVLFGTAGKTVGTVWAVAHDAALGFNAEQLRQLQNLALFAAPALQAVAALGLVPTPHPAMPASEPHGASENQHATFNNLIENAPFGVYVVDAQFCLCQASAAAHKAFASVQPLIGRHFGDVVRAVWPEPFASEVLAHFRRTLDTGKAHAQPTLSKLRNDKPDLESYDWKIERIVLPDGTFGVVCYFYDLTERQQAAEALRLLTTQFETLVNVAPLGICLVDAQLRIRQVNPLALPEFGDIPRLIGSDLAAVMQNVWGAARADDIMQQFRHTLATGEPFEAEELIAERFDRGTTAYYEWQIHRIPLPDGSHGVVCYFRDISTRVQAQAEIRDSESRFHALVSASSDVIYRMNADWTELRHLLGREFVADTHEPNRSWLEKYIPLEDQRSVLEVIQAAIGSKGVFELEHRVMRVDGTPGWTFSRAIPMLDGHGQIKEWFGAASDVTARKQAEAVIRASEAQSQAILESISDGFFALDSDWRFTYINAAGERFLDRTPGDLIGKSLWEKFPGTVGSEFEHVYRQVLARQVSESFTAYYPNLDRWYEATAYPAPLGLSVYFRDVTNRRQLEQERKQFAALVDASSDFIGVAGLDQRGVYVNKAGQALVGLEPGQVSSINVLDFFPESERDRILSLITNSEGRDHVVVDTWFQHLRSGHLIPVSWSFLKLRDASGNVSGYATVTRDLTERNNADRLLRASEERRRLALTAAELGTWFVDPATRATKTDAKYRVIFGTTEEWTDYMEAVAIIHPDDQSAVLEAVTAATRLEDPAPYTIEYRIVHPDGSLRWILANGRASFEGIGGARRVTSFDGTVADITSRKGIEIDLNAALAAAEDANHAKSDFLSRMSHELRSPLNAVLGFAQLLQSGMPPPNALQEESVGEILKAGWYLLGLIDEILDLSLIESGRLSCVLVPVRLAELLDDCQAMVQGLAAARGIHLSLPQLDDGCTVIADRTRLKQVFINILSNAIKYNREGGTVRMHFEDTGQSRICICIEDSGSGLSPEQLGHIFEPFERLGQEAGVIEGTGIGLALSKRLVELMGGRIGVHSVVGQGSVFWVELDMPGTQTPAPAPAPAAVGPRPYTVLSVEDNRANQLLLQRLLAQRADIDLVLAGDGEQGVQLAHAIQPDVVLMDINLPGMSGLQAMERLAADAATAHIPVIAISALAMQHDIAKGLQAGFFRYLSKPIKLAALTEAMDAALAKAHP